MEWCIDAWDPLGGRAFASQRSRNQDIAEYADRRGPTVYIGPPGFQPELIANLAIAIAACHSANFDPRVPPLQRDGEAFPNELAFPSADAVADFVRRTFVGGSRGRGGGEEAPAPDGGEPQGPPTIEGDIKAKVPGLVGYLGFWENPDSHIKKDKNEIDRVHSLDRANRATFGRHRKRPVANIEDGALQLIAALLEGFPRSPNEAYVERWQFAAGSLDGALSELGLWRSWSLGGQHLDRANAYLLRSINSLLPHVPLRFKDAAHAAHLLMAWPFNSSAISSPIETYLEYNLHYWHPLHNNALTRDSYPPAERYEALFTWSVPRYAQAELGAKTVGQLLATFISSPAKFVGKSHAMLDIIGFAAAFLGSRTEDRLDARWRESAAANWLARSMPRYMFGQEAESVIFASLVTSQMQAASAGA